VIVTFGQFKSPHRWYICWSATVHDPTTASSGTGVWRECHLVNVHRHWFYLWKSVCTAMPLRIDMGLAKKLIFRSLRGHTCVVQGRIDATRLNSKEWLVIVGPWTANVHFSQYPLCSRHVCPSVVIDTNNTMRSTGRKHASPFVNSRWHDDHLDIASTASA
jgi:hypothetical protein